MSYFGIPIRNGAAIGLGSTAGLALSFLQRTGVPSLALNFTNGTTFDSRITFTRASSATFTNSSGFIESAASNVPRIDYNPSTLVCNGLLIEDQRTNLMLYSDAFNNASWTKVRASVTANAVVSPDATQNADTLIEDTSVNNTHLAFSSAVAVATGTIYTYTVYAKPAGRSWFSLQIGTGSEAYGAIVPFCFFNASNGTIGSSAYATASITPVGNGWFRCILVAVATTAATTTNIRLKLADSGSTDAYTGNGTSGMNFWGAQLEAGSFATSYIPTVASQVTRSADVASMTGTNFSSWYNQSEGTFVVDGDFIGGTSGTYPHPWGACGVNSDTDFISPGWFAPSGQLRFGCSVSGASQADFPFGISITPGNVYKQSTAYKLNNFAASGNGSAVATDTTGTLPTATRLLLGGSVQYQPNLNGHIRTVTYWPARLSNAALQSLSS